VPAALKYILTTFYYNSTQSNIIGTNLADGAISHLKFFLTVSSAQDVGIYSNNVSIIGIEAGYLP
jgi:hypothetical protein